MNSSMHCTVTLVSGADYSIYGTHSEVQRAIADSECAFVELLEWYDGYDPACHCTSRPISIRPEAVTSIRPGPPGNAHSFVEKCCSRGRGLCRVCGMMMQELPVNAYEHEDKALVPDLDDPEGLIHAGCKRAVIRDARRVMHQAEVEELVL